MKISSSNNRLISVYQNLILHIPHYLVWKLFCCKMNTLLVKRMFNYILKMEEH